MMYSFVNRFKLVALYMPGSLLINFMLGMISGLAFAPSFFIPGLIGLGALCYQTFYLPTAKQAWIKGFIFGFGHFLSSMYWISIGVSVYINEFWWAIPFALFGLPLILACFIAASCFLSWFARNSKYYHILFCLAWILFEWIRSWIFTGLPWNLLGYAFAFSDILIQISSIIGIYGLSFIVIYVATSFFFLLAKNKEQFKISITTSILIISLIYIYGTIRLQNNPTIFSEIIVRLVQPSIPQIAKWDIEKVWENLDAHINLSEAEGKADIIIWSEAALVIPYKYQIVKNKILNMLHNSNAILITGGIADNNKFEEEFEIYTSLQAISPTGNILFEYHKSHLVPFGEYMPLKNIIPLKKLTPGFLDYTPGEGRNVYLQNFNLFIKPLICYESIFPSLVHTSTKNTDVIINVTNDTWYGRSSGPYQHFHISRLRAIENGLPMLRVANNGITAIIDPMGRVIEKLPLDKIGIIEGKIPLKIPTPTFYSRFGNLGILIVVFLVLILQPLITFIIKFYFILFRRLD